MFFLFFCTLFLIFKVKLAFYWRFFVFVPPSSGTCFCWYQQECVTLGLFQDLHLLLFFDFFVVNMFLVSSEVVRTSGPIPPPTGCVFGSGPISDPFPVENWPFHFRSQIRSGWSNYLDKCKNSFLTRQYGIFQCHLIEPLEKHKKFSLSTAISGVNYWVFVCVAYFESYFGRFLFPWSKVYKTHCNSMSFVIFVKIFGENLDFVMFFLVCEFRLSHCNIVVFTA